MSIRSLACALLAALSAMTGVCFAAGPRDRVVPQLGVSWQTTPEGASSAAAGTRRTSDDKPIVWFRHVGELSGPMCSASHAMRVGSYAHPDVQALIRTRFVPLSQNMEKLAGAGSSVGHLLNDPPGICTSRIAHQNCQALFLTPQREIFHAATGYLSPAELVAEMQFALGLFGEMQKRPKHARRLVVESHRNRLKQLGFTENDLQTPTDPLRRFFAESGIPAGGVGANVGEVFQQIARQRVLADHRYLLNYPLISQSDFERDPAPLVGSDDFFFQSGPASGRNTGKFGVGEVR